MDRYFSVGTKLNMPGKSGIFEIQEKIGRGASAVVYRAFHTDEQGNITEHLLKEYNPKHIALHRDNTGVLCCSEGKDEKEFMNGLVRFEAGYKTQLEIRNQIDALKNVTSNIQDIYYANGTQYIDMTCNWGEPYDKVQETSLYNLLRRMRGLAKVIGHYHKAGLLHLDIKPGNIFVIPETTEMVLLFDFDSVIKKEDVKNGVITSYTKSWAAPEQLLNHKNKIGETTDLYAIGEILFYQIMGRHSETDERRSFSKYNIDKNAKIFENVNPQVFPLLQKVLKKTICNITSLRYQSADELISALDEMIELSHPEKAFLKSSIPMAQNLFIGRNRELEEIHYNLSENNVMFISGIGGIGKTELVKQYAKKYQDEYDTVIFAPFLTDITSMLINDVTVPIYNFSQYQEENPLDYYVRKLRKLKELCDERVLFIVDNLDEEDENINAITELNCKVLVTTRRDFSEYGYKQLNLDSLEKKEDIIAIFNAYYTRALSEDEASQVEQIIDLVAGHTMVVELLAKQMMAGRITPAKMLEKLQVGISNSGHEKVKSGKDGMLAKRSAYEHIQMLFNISELNDKEKYILANLSLLPYTGVPVELFHDWCELEDYEELNELAANGWIKVNKETDYVSMHPVIAEIEIEVLQQKSNMCDKMLGNILEFADNDTAIIENNLTLGWISNIGKEIANRLLVIGIKTINVSTFLTRIATEHSRLMQMDVALKCCKKALEIRLSIKNIDPGYIAASYSDLGVLCKNTKNYEKAKKYFKDALSIYIKEFGMSSRHTARVYKQMGSLESTHGNFNGAIEYYNKAIETFQSTRDDYEGLMHTFLAVGNSCINHKEYEKAEKYLLNALECGDYVDANKYIAEQMLIYKSLGRLYTNIGNFEEAEHYYKNALEIQKNLFSEHHEETIDTYRSLGNLSIKAEKFDMAREYFEKVLSICKSLYKEDHPAVIKAYNILKNLYYK